MSLKSIDLKEINKKNENRNKNSKIQKGIIITKNKIFREVHICGGYILVRYTFASDTFQ